MCGCIFEMEDVGGLPKVLQKDSSKLMQKVPKSSPRLERERAPWHSDPLMCKASVPKYHKYKQFSPRKLLQSCIGVVEYLLELFQ